MIGALVKMPDYGPRGKVWDFGGFGWPRIRFYQVAPDSVVDSYAPVLNRIPGLFL